jgi:hypothetical protein
MPTTIRTHPWWVAGLAAALAAAATVCVLALAGAFDTNDPFVVESPPVVVVKPTTGGDTKGDLPASQLGDGAAKHGPSGDTKDDVTAGTTRVVGQELVLEDRAAGAGH